MDFCPKCSTRLVFTSTIQRCLKCQYEGDPPVEKAKVRHRQSQPLVSNVYVLDPSALNLRTMAIVSGFCEVCNRVSQAEVWMVAGESSGISSITFFRCIACRHTWRETDRG